MPLGLVDLPQLTIADQQQQLLDELVRTPLSDADAWCAAFSRFAQVERVAAIPSVASSR